MSASRQQRLFANRRLWNFGLFCYAICFFGWLLGIVGLSNFNARYKAVDKAHTEVSEKEMDSAITSLMQMVFGAFAALISLVCFVVGLFIVGYLVIIF
jgi:hypothetical protein